MPKIRLSDESISDIKSTIYELIASATWDFLCDKGEVKMIPAFFDSDTWTVDHPSLNENHKAELEQFIAKRMQMHCDYARRISENQKTDY